MEGFSESKYKLGKKRSSLDASLKQPERKSKASSKESKNIIGLKLDIHKETRGATLSLKPNMTHRVEPQAQVVQLREEVELLRVENEELRDRIRNFLSNENDLHVKINRLEKELYEKRKMELSYREQIQHQEDKISKYSDKIKELFESLIAEKKKNVGISTIKMALSPSNSINCSLNVRKFENEGEKDYHSVNIHTFEEENFKGS